VKKVVELLQSIATIIALIVGGWWTYDAFVRERDNLPHALLEQKLEHWTLDGSKNLIRVELSLSNVGKKELVVSHIDLEIEQISSPRPACTEAAERCPDNEIQKEFKNPIRDQNGIDWTPISVRHDTRQHILEPKEKEIIDYEFVLSPNVSLVRTKAWVRNEELSKGENPGMGWVSTHIYKLGKEK